MSAGLLDRPAAAVRVVRRLVAADQMREARPPLPSSTSLLLWFVTAISALALWGVAYPVVIGGLQESATQQHLFADLRMQLSQATAPIGPVAYGKPLAVLDSPQAGLRGAVVVEGTGGPDLEKGPGHRRDTVLPGQAGTTVLLGRVLTFGGPFRHLAELRPGDLVKLTTGQGVFTYLVERVRRPGDPLPPPLAAGKGRLVLGTAEGKGWRGGFAPTSVVYVDAALNGVAQSSPGGRPSVVPASETSMGVSTEPLLPLIFWLQGLLVAVVGAVWLRLRWGRRQALVVSLPVVLAVGIGASATASQLLPNLL